MATTVELTQQISNLQAQVAQLTAQRDAQAATDAANAKAVQDSLAAAVADAPTLHRTATALHTQRCPKGPSCPFFTETAPTDAELWALPEHSFWARAAAVAILAGVLAPVGE